MRLWFYTRYNGSGLESPRFFESSCSCIESILVHVRYHGVRFPIALSHGSNVFGEQVFSPINFVLHWWGVFYVPLWKSRFSKLPVTFYIESRSLKCFQAGPCPSLGLFYGSISNWKWVAGGAWCVLFLHWFQWSRKLTIAQARAILSVIFWALFCDKHCCIGDTFCWIYTRFNALWRRAGFFPIVPHHGLVSFLGFTG